MVPSTGGCGRICTRSAASIPSSQVVAMRAKPTDRVLVTVGIVLSLCAVSMIAFKNKARARPRGAPPASASFGVWVPQRLIVVAFRVNECPSVIEGLRRLNEIATTGQIPVHGILLDPSKTTRSIAEILDGSGITFPVTPDSADAGRQFLQRVGYAESPVLLVFNNAGQLKLAESLPDSATFWTASDIAAAMRIAKEPPSASPPPGTIGGARP